MSDGFTVAAALGEPTIFDCPNCHETIDARAETCRFCGMKVDHEAAHLAALQLAKINQGCSDASYMRSTALAIPVFFVLRLVPFFGFVGLIGFIGLTVGIPIWTMIWWFKYGEIASRDDDFVKARRTVKIITIAVPIVLFVFVILPFLVAFVLGILAAMKR